MACECCRRILDQEALLLDMHIRIPCCSTDGKSSLRFIFQCTAGAFPSRWAMCPDDSARFALAISWVGIARTKAPTSLEQSWER
jgi:hypothetical protein